LWNENSRYRGLLTKNRFSQALIVIIVLGLTFSSFFVSVFGLEPPATENPCAVYNSEWRLTVGGYTNSLNLSINDLATMPKTSRYGELSCEGAFIESGNWTGVSLAFLLNESGIDPQAVTVGFQATDGYQVFFPMGAAMNGNMIIAYELDGLPLQEVLRLVVPGANGDVWISNIVSIGTLTVAVQTGAMNSRLPIPSPSQIPTLPLPVTPKPTKALTPTPVVTLSPTPEQTSTLPPSIVPTPQIQKPSTPKETFSLSPSQSPQEQATLGLALPWGDIFILTAILGATFAVGLAALFSITKKSRISQKTTPTTTTE
jgi:DMSO/TMAO reductase YedYZ molybdopterin-dependent catalytic subunit